MNNLRLASMMILINLIISLLYFRYANLCSYYYLSDFDTLYGTLKLGLFIPLQWAFGAFILVLFTPGVIASSFANSDVAVLLAMAFTTMIVIFCVYGIAKIQARKIRFFLAMILSVIANIAFFSMACGVLSV